ncbi:hypothetical protein F5884DRAFT_858695 [Xylogone sp. PMI_703]|nr:hypothetical protein F5884DRAFT_858695 [Xylogone sp. PMI_703]
MREEGKSRRKKKNYPQRVLGTWIMEDQPGLDQKQNTSPATSSSDVSSRSGMVQQTNDSDVASNQFSGHHAVEDVDHGIQLALNHLAHPNPITVLGAGRVDTKALEQMFNESCSHLRSIEKAILCENALNTTAYISTRDSSWHFYYVHLWTGINGMTLRNYISLQQLTVVGNRSWSLIHSGLSAAILLAVLREHCRNPEAKEL